MITEFCYPIGPEAWLAPTNQKGSLIYYLLLMTRCIKKPKISIDSFQRLLIKESCNLTGQEAKLPKPTKYGSLRH